LRTTLDIRRGDPAKRDGRYRMKDREGAYDVNTDMTQSSMHRTGIKADKRSYADF
jgi:hypothetical protein